LLLKEGYRGADHVARSGALIHTTQEFNRYFALLLRLSLIVGWGRFSLPGLLAHDSSPTHAKLRYATVVQIVP
jgi:hypothetical protein